MTFLLLLTYFWSEVWGDVTVRQRARAKRFTLASLCFGIHGLICLRLSFSAVFLEGRVTLGVALEPGWWLLRTPAALLPLAAPAAPPAAMFNSGGAARPFL